MKVIASCNMNKKLRGRLLKQAGVIVLKMKIAAYKACHVVSLIGCITFTFGTQEIRVKMRWSPRVQGQ